MCEKPYQPNEYTRYISMDDYRRVVHGVCSDLPRVRVPAWRYPDEDGVQRVKPWELPLVLTTIRLMRGEGRDDRFKT